GGKRARPRDGGHGGIHVWGKPLWQNDRSSLPEPKLNVGERRPLRTAGIACRAAVCRRVQQKPSPSIPLPMEGGRQACLTPLPQEGGRAAGAGMSSLRRRGSVSGLLSFLRSSLA